MPRNNKIKLYNIALALECDFNLISFGQFYKNGIIYYNNLIAMTLIRNRKIIPKAKREQNFFILNLVYPKKAMEIISPQSKAIILIKQQPKYLAITITR